MVAPVLPFPFHPKTQKLDLAFLVDSTGSMSSYIAGAKDAINEIVESVKRTAPLLNLQVAFVG